MYIKHTHYKAYIMGLWKVNGETFELNLSQSLIHSYKSKGGRFGWFKMNPGLDDEKDDAYFESKEETVEGKKEKYRCLKKTVRVQDSTGAYVVGRIIHLCRGQTTATPLYNWFIILPENIPQ